MKNDPRNCRCLACQAALAMEARRESGPLPAGLPPCPWERKLTEGDLFPALYLPHIDPRGALWSS
jgi:hypothetical protein